MQPAAERARDEYVKLPLSFEVNRGQADSHVQFISRSDGYDVLITPTEALMTLRNSPLAVASAGSPRSPLRMKLIGANSNSPAVGLDELPYKSNYFIGNDPKKWLTDVPAYARVKCQNVYPGIDLFYYGNGGQLEYDFVVAPGANYKGIRILFEGADRIRLDDRGDLAITTAAGEIHHRKPVVYQERDGLKRAIDARYLLNSSRQLELEIGAYDAGEMLVIDPVLNYATYFGSRSGGDALAGVAFDAAGNAYVVGTTASPDLPTTPGALQTAGRSVEAFIAKLNPAGSEVLYVTYLGGSSSDNGNRIAVDRKGNAYVTGTTFSADFPKTIDFGSGAPGLIWHCFVTKLNATGTALVYSAVLGVPGEMAEGVAIAVDAAGQATIAGNTDSTRFRRHPVRCNRNRAARLTPSSLDSIVTAAGSFFPPILAAMARILSQVSRLTKKAMPMSLALPLLRTSLLPGMPTSERNKALTQTSSPRSAAPVTAFPIRLCWRAAFPS